LSMAVIRVEQVSKHYQNDNGEIFRALRSVDLEWNEQESIALCGESGSGKSTLARLLLGLEKPSEGAIRFGRVSLAELSHRQWRVYRRRLQGVFQDASGALNPGRSVFRNMEEGLINLTDCTARERRIEIATLMKRFGLSQSLLEIPVRQLSGGEQRRVALVRALAVKPTFLIMDEVLAGLDIITADAVLSTLEEYRQSYGCAYLLITHDRYSAKRLGERIYVMEHGRLSE